MKMSDQGLKLLIEREDSRTEAYRDTKGIWTIGIGHTGPEVHGGLVWTEEQVVKAFAEDVAKFEDAVTACVKVPLTQNQFDALVSFSHNCGADALAHGGENKGPSSILLALNAGNYGAAALAFNNWRVPKEITSRRNGEREQFRGSQFKARIEGP